MVVVQVARAVRLAVYGRGRAEDGWRRRCRKTPRGAKREVRGDRAAGQVSGTSGTHHVTATPQQLQHVVEQIAGARTPFAQVLFGQQTQRFAVHLEQFVIDSRQVEFDFGPLYESVHVLFGPDSRVGNCANENNNQNTGVSSLLKTRVLRIERVCYDCNNCNITPGGSRTQNISFIYLFIKKKKTKCFRERVPRIYVIV